MRRPVRVLMALVGTLSLLALPGVAAAHGPHIESFGAPAPANALFPVMQQNFFRLLALPEVADAHGPDIRGVGAAAPASARFPVLQQSFRLLANLPQPTHTPIGGTDLAFWGTRAYAGSFGGFRIIDIKQPASPKVLADVQCPGQQGDVSVWNNELLFLSDDEPLTSPRCGGVPTDFQSTPDAWEGIRIFDVGNPRDPVYLTAVATDCGSHTHTLVPDLKNDRVLIYVSSFNLFDDGPDCRAPTVDEPISHSKISIIEVPLDDPHAAAVINEPDSMFEGGQPCTPTQSNPLVPSDQFFACNETDDDSLNSSTRGCHDIQVLLEAHLAACSALSEAQIWDISDPEEPRIIKRLDDPNFEAWHNAVFTWDGEYVRVHRRRRHRHRAMVQARRPRHDRGQLDLPLGRPVDRAGWPLQDAAHHRELAAGSQLLHSAQRHDRPRARPIPARAGLLRARLGGHRLHRPAAPPGDRILPGR